MYMRMSSKKTRTNRRRKGQMTSFMSAWNVAGALHRPKAITRKELV
jgi:hypothetical protein